MEVPRGKFYNPIIIAGKTKVTGSSMISSYTPSVEAV